MKRLIDQPGPHAPIYREAVRLLSAAEATHRAQPGAKARVRIALVRRPRPRPTPWMRAAVLVAIAFASALASGATLVRQWAHHADDASPSVALAPVIAPAHRPLAHRAAGPALAEVESVPATPAQEAPLAAVSAPRARLVTGTGTVPAVRDAVHAPAPRSISVEETAQLVLDGMAALRRDHDGRRAEALLDEYLRRSPDGPLAEEAMALSIEAASAAHDDRARALAARYLAAYPHGRFREAAERAASRSGP